MSSSSDDGITTSDAMDLSINNFWVVAYFPFSDPGKDFEIVDKKQLVQDSWDTLQKGAEFKIKFGSAILQGIVVTVSEDHELLSTNFATIVEEFRERIPKKYNRKSVANSDSQTDFNPRDNMEYQTLQEEYNELQTKYNNLEAEFRNLQAERDSLTTQCSNYKTEAKNMEARISSVQNNLLSFVSKLDPEADNDGTPAAPEPEPANLPRENKENSAKHIELGPGGTKISRQVFDSIKWTSYTAATRKLLITLFPRKVLATHSLTGKPSPAFMAVNKVIKSQLNPVIVSDVIHFVARKCRVTESLVRNSITTKCADENKMYRKRMAKKQKNATDLEDGIKQEEQEDSE